MTQPGVKTLWAWKVEGTQPLSSPGAMVREWSDSGMVVGEGTGEALHYLIVNGGIWDNIDQSKPLTITIEPVEDAIRRDRG